MLKKGKMSIFTAGCFIMHMKSLLSLSGLFLLPDFLEMTLIVCSLACFVATILAQRYSVKTLLLYAMLTVVTLISSLLSGQFIVLSSVVCILALRNRSLDDFMSRLEAWQGWYLVFQISTAILWAIVNPNYELYTNIMDVNRYHFGFAHPNVLAVVVAGYVYLWVWNRFHRINKNHLYIILLVTAVMYLFTRSRTLLISMLVLVLLLALRNKNGWRQTMIKASAVIVPVLGILTYLVISLFSKGGALVTLIDTLVSGRVRLGGYALTHSGLSWIGQEISYAQGAIMWDPTWRINNFTFDNLYSYCLVQVGVVWLAAVTYAFFRLSKLKNYKISVFIILWAIYGLTEIHGLNGFICMPIFMTVLIFSKRQKKVLCKEERNL